jgi:hypothetical protein
MVCDNFLDRVFAGLLKDKKAMIVQPGHMFHILRALFPLLREIDVYGTGRREFSFFKEGPSTGHGVHPQRIEVEEVRRNEDGSESGYYAFCSVFLCRDEKVVEGGKILDFGRGDWVDVSEESVKGSDRFRKIDVWKFVRRVMGLREGKHIPEDG